MVAGRAAVCCARQIGDRRCGTRRGRLVHELDQCREVFYTLAKQQGGNEAESWIAQLLPAMPIQLVEADKELVLAAARWKAKAKISYSDAFALATADRVGAMVITGDPEMKGMDIVEWIGA